MEHRQLKYFVGVAEALSFSNAAKTLYVSQSALSQQISLLETELGVDLFDSNKRTKERKVELTEAGHVFLREAKKILALSDMAIESVRKISQKKNIVRLGIFRRYELLALFTKSFPDVEIRVVEFHFNSDTEQELLNETVDIAVTFLPIKKEGISTKIYQEGHLVVILSKNHPLATKERLTFAELRNEKFVGISKAINPLANYTDLISNKLGFNIEESVAQTVNSLDLMLSMISLGIGISMVPSFIKLSSDSGLVTVPLYNNDGSLFTDINVQIGVSYKTSTATPLIRAFIDKVENIT